MRDGDETDQDCGGSCPGCGHYSNCNTTADCAAGFECLMDDRKRCFAAACNNGMLDSGESAIDCGGAHLCPGCAIGQTCTAPSDCLSGNCAVGLCAP
jgi:hypothetical protein